MPDSRHAPREGIGYAETMEPGELRRITPVAATATRIASYLRVMGLNARLRTAPSGVSIEVTEPSTSAANEAFLATLEVTDKGCWVLAPVRSAATLSWQEALAHVARLADRDPPRLLHAG